MATPDAPLFEASDPDIWNRYWQSDRIASCFDDAGARNYDDAIGVAWAAFFAALPGGARILDLCTGNGAVALIAAGASAAHGKRFEIVAVDQADIDPPTFVERHRRELATISFRPKTRAEALPFADAGFDAVVSQYGIEYSDLRQSLAELVRVVRPGGRARLVMHAAEGIVCVDSKRVLEEADFLLEEVDLPGAARRCFVAVTEAERTRDASEGLHVRAREALAGFEAALAATAGRIPSALDKTMMRNSGAVLLDTFQRHSRFEIDQLVAKAEEVRAEIEAHRGRLKALINAAVSEKGLGRIATTLEGAGASVERSMLRNGEALIGYVVEARFPA